MGRYVCDGNWGTRATIKQEATVQLSWSRIIKDTCSIHIKGGRFKMTYFLSYWFIMFPQGNLSFTTIFFSLSFTWEGSPGSWHMDALRGHDDWQGQRLSHSGSSCSDLPVHKWPELTCWTWEQVNLHSFALNYELQKSAKTTLLVTDNVF